MLLEQCGRFKLLYGLCCLFISLEKTFQEYCVNVTYGVDLTLEEWCALRSEQSSCSVLVHHFEAHCAILDIHGIHTCG